jgi:hypothetical protein
MIYYIIERMELFAKAPYLEQRLSVYKTLIIQGLNLFHANRDVLYYLIYVYLVLIKLINHPSHAV